MPDRKEIRLEIVNYLCGKEGLKDEFIELLKAGGLSEYEGRIIKNKLLKDIDSGLDMDIMFHSYYLHLYKLYHRLIDPKKYPFFKEGDEDIVDLRICDDENDPFNSNNIPIDELEEYRSDEEYLELLRKQYPQTVDEAIDILIEGLNKESIVYAKEANKSQFSSSAHFGLGMYVRNQFGLNNHKGIDLMEDIERNGGSAYFMPDSASGFLMDKLWERIQDDYDEIILSKETDEKG